MQGEEPEDKEDAQKEEDSARVDAMLPEAVEVVICAGEHEFQLVGDNDVAEHLLVGEQPGCEDAVQGWSFQHHFHRGLVGLSAIHGRLLVAVGHHEALSHVQAQD